VCDVILRGHDAGDGQRRERRRAAKDSRVAWAMCGIFTVLLAGIIKKEKRKKKRKRRREEEEGKEEKEEKKGERIGYV